MKSDSKRGEKKVLITIVGTQNRHKIDSKYCQKYMQQNSDKTITKQMTNQ